MSEAAVIEIESLHKAFGSQKVLKGVDLTLNEGENLVVLGKSGTGKSVLIKCIVGLLVPEKGSITVFGEKINASDKKKLNELRKEIGFLFQSGALYDSMNVKQNLEFPLVRIRKELKENERMQKIEEVLDNVGLADAIYKMPSELSGGMRKRIGLARTLIVGPRIILYDEPTTGLDPVTSEEISELINKIREKYKTSSIIITHDLPCARMTADRMILLNDGKIAAEGQAEDFKASEDPVVQAFFKEL